MWWDALLYLNWFGILHSAFARGVGVVIYHLLPLLFPVGR